MKSIWKFTFPNVLSNNHQHTDTRSRAHQFLFHTKYLKFAKSLFDNLPKLQSLSKAKKRQTFFLSNPTKHQNCQTFQIIKKSQQTAKKLLPETEMINGEKFSLKLEQQKMYFSHTKCSTGRFSLLHFHLNDSNEHKY